VYTLCVNIDDTEKGNLMNQIVHTKIQKWGNGLALRVAGLIRDIPQFEQDAAVDVEVFEDGFTVRKVMPNKKGFVFPVKEQDLLKGLTPATAHADELAKINLKDIGFE
jgi:antitoxin MazE